MSVALIEESAKEVRRLAIAGSPLAVGDFRLKKLIPPLEQAGAKVPVFAQIARAISELVNGTESESATRLLTLSTLLNAVLFTQGQTGAAGDFQKLESFATNGTSTRTAGRVLKPLIQALSTAGAGRFEIVKTAVERGAFNDIRLLDPAIHALGDSHAELADLVAEKILPGYGPGIKPRLQAGFDIKGRRHEGRKLEVLHRLDPDETLDLCKQALADGSIEVKIAAIGCLGQHEECLGLVLEQTKGKNKQLCASALQALAGYERPEITKVFTDLIKDNALDILVRPFRVLRNRQVLNTLLAEGRQSFDLILKNDSQQIPRFVEILNCLVSRRDPEVENFLLDALTGADKLPKVKAAKNTVVSGTDLIGRLAEMVYGIGSPRALEVILVKRELLPLAVYPDVLRTAIRVWPASRFFTEFSPLLQETRGTGRDKRECLETLVHGTFVRFELFPDGSADLDRQLMPDKVAWDPRWLEAAIKADSRALVCWMARPDHKDTVDYLLKPGSSKAPFNQCLSVRGLVRCQYPKVTQFFLAQIATKIKGGNYQDYEFKSLLDAAQYLPKSDLPKLDEFAAKLDESFVDEFLVAINPLRQTENPN